MQQRSRHPEVNQQSAPGLEPNNQILAATIDLRHALALELTCDLEGVERTREARIGDLHALESPAFQRGRKPAADGLYFRKFGHGTTVARHGCETPWCAHPTRRAPVAHREVSEASSSE